MTTVEAPGQATTPTPAPSEPSSPASQEPQETTTASADEGDAPDEPAAVEPLLAPEATEDTASDDATEAQPKDDGKDEANAFENLSLSEGSPLAAEHLKDVAAFAQENGLTPEQAQKQVEREEDLLVARAQADQSNAAKAHDQWVAELKADPDLGGENLARTRSRTYHALHVADPTGELTKLLNEPPCFIDNPVVARGLTRLGELLGESSNLVNGDQTPRAGELSAKEQWERDFPHSPFPG